MEFGLAEIWAQMGFIAKSVVAVLFILSVWSLYITVERLLVFRKSSLQSMAFARQAGALLAKGRPDEALEAARKLPHGHVARVTRAGLIEFGLDQATDNPLKDADLVEAARRAIERETLITYSDLRKGVGSLATIATTSPFVGLFGTVIGIINSFRGMAMEGSGGIGAVSAGIAEALVTTALGLFVAIPAAWMFNSLTNRLERFQVEMSNSSSELIDHFIKSQVRRRHGISADA